MEVLKYIVEEENKGNEVSTETIKEKMKEAYKNEPSKHQMFISEIVNIWIKK